MTTFVTRLRHAAVLLLLLLAPSAFAESLQDSTVFRNSNIVLSEMKASTFRLVGPPTSNSAIYFGSGGRRLRLTWKSPRAWQLDGSREFTLRDIFVLSSERAEVSLAAKRFGGVRFVVETLDGSPLLVSQVLAATAFACEPWPTQPVIGNRASKVAHIYTCNHLPADSLGWRFASQRDVEARGFRLCPLCFPSTTGVGIPDYAFERELGLATRAQRLAQADPLPQHPQAARVREAGERVLARWPLPLRGYNYVFGIVDDPVVNAVACPTGFVYLNSGLVDALESEDELEAVLAHEITHVERRHGYRAYLSAVANQGGAALAAFLFGAAAASQSSTDGFTPAAQAFASVLGSLIAELADAQHSRRDEEEADAFANLYARGVASEGIATGIKSIMSKLQFAETMYGGQPGRFDALMSHPEGTFRVRRARETQLGLLPQGTNFFGLSQTGDTLATLRVEAWSMAPVSSERAETPTAIRDRSVPAPVQVFDLRLYCTIETYGLLPVGTRVKDATATVGGSAVILDDDEDTFLPDEGLIGFALSCRSAKPLRGDKIESLGITLPSVKRWVR